MKEFEAPKMEIINLENVDIITASQGCGNDGCNLKCPTYCVVVCGTNCQQVGFVN